MPVGTEDKPVTFDSAAFKTEILGELDTRINTAVNGATKGLKTDFQKMMDELSAKIVPVVTKKGDDVVGEPKSIAELNTRLVAQDKVVKDITAKLEQTEKDKQEALKTARESSRVSAFDSAIGDLQFASPKAKQQFRDAYLNKVEYGEDGNSLIIKVGDKPMEMAGFLANEYNESTHLQPPQSRGGAGASAGKVVNTSGFNFDANMTPAQVNALPAEQKQAYREQLSAAISAGGH